MAPDHIEAALKENVKLKLEILNLSKEMKKLKKLLFQQDRDLAEAQREREVGKGGKEAREIESMYREEKQRRKVAEAERKKVEEELEGRGAPDDLRALLEDAEAAEAVWRQRSEQLEGELENVKASLEDQVEEMNRVKDAGDRAQEDLERLQAEAEAKAALGESVGISKGREARLLAKLEQVSLAYGYVLPDEKQDNSALQAELEALRKAGTSDVDELEDVGRLSAE